MNPILTLVLFAITFAIGIYIGPFVRKTQEQIRLERNAAYIDSTYLQKNGVTSIWKPDGWEHDYFSYQLRSWDGGKTWYALETEAPNSTGLKEDRVIILGEVDKVYPGLMKHEKAWDNLTSHVKEHGPLDDVNKAKELFEGTGIEVAESKDTCICELNAKGEKISGFCLTHKTDWM